MIRKKVYNIATAPCLSHLTLQTLTLLKPPDFTTLTTLTAGYTLCLKTPHLPDHRKRLCATKDLPRCVKKMSSLLSLASSYLTQPVLHQIHPAPAPLLRAPLTRWHTPHTNYHHASLPFSYLRFSLPPLLPPLLLPLPTTPTPHLPPFPTHDPVAPESHAQPSPDSYLPLSPLPLHLSNTHRLITGRTYPTPSLTTLPAPTTPLHTRLPVAHNTDSPHTRTSPPSLHQYPFHPTSNTRRHISLSTSFLPHSPLTALSNSTTYTPRQLPPVLSLPQTPNT